MSATTKARFAAGPSRRKDGNVHNHEPNRVKQLTELLVLLSVLFGMLIKALHLYHTLLK